MATLQSNVGNHDHALELFQEALAIERAGNNRLREARMLANVGSAYGGMGEHAKASEYLEQAITMFRTVEGGRTALSTTTSNVAHAHPPPGPPGEGPPLLE